MRKGLIICFLVLALLISFKDAYALECKPTASWKIDPQFYVGETGKLVATINNNCDKTFDVRTEVNAERTEGYIKVYKVQSEDETPRPKTHDVSGGLSYAYTSIEKKSKDSVVFFIQPDELALAGSYVLFENFYIEGELEQSNEIKIRVLKPIRVMYSIPAQLQLNNPTLSTLTISNIGTEIITSLKICLSSADSIVSFSEPCKTWVNLPSGFTDKFTLYINGLRPGTYEDAIEVKIDYNTFTGLQVLETYYHPTLKITAVQGAVPSLTYTTTKSAESITFQITNGGNGIAYDCYIKINSPANCFINSSDIANFTRASEGNSYLIGCSDIILPGDKYAKTINFDSSQMASICPVSGSIFYKDGFGEGYETKITSLNLLEVATTIPIIPGADRNYIWYILIIVIVAVAIILTIFKVPKFRSFLSKKLSKLGRKEIEKQENEEKNK